MRPILMSAALLSVGACAEYRRGNAPLHELSGIWPQIESYYEGNATEEDWTCNEVQMQNIDESQVVSQTADQVKVAVHYHFTSFDESPSQGGDQCQGVNTRFFTFERGRDGALTLASMSGPQRRP